MSDDDAERTAWIEMGMDTPKHRRKAARCGPVL